MAPPYTSTYFVDLKISSCKEVCGFTGHPETWAAGGLGPQLPREAPRASGLMGRLQNRWPGGYPQEGSVAAQPFS